LIEQCRTTHQPVSRRTIAVIGAGGPMHLGVTVSPIDRAERSGGVICLFSDLTAIVEMEDQLRLKDALARLGELTAGLAHEFRNGLATIHGYARLLDPALLPDRYRPYIESLRSETDQLGRVVTHFLNFARPEALSSVRLALRDVVARAIDEVRRDLPSDTVLEISGDFGEVDGDEQLLKQAFDNLCRNACQACTEAGIRPEIRVHGLVDHAHRTVHVTVDDNGPGVPELERAKVFQPFFSTRANGTGLGLSIVQKIVLAHNGRISVADAPGRGARFELTLPCADRRESSLARPA
jgi:signal transduction histidine kinase